MVPNKLEALVYKAGVEIQAELPPRTGVLLRLLVEKTGYSLPTVHKAVLGLKKKKLAGWPLKSKNRKKGALRFWRS